MAAQKGYGIKDEGNSAVCWSCLAQENLRNMHQEYQYNGKEEIYANMLSYCFSIQIEERHKSCFFICASCIMRLRDAANFRTLIEITRSTFQRAITGKEVHSSDDDEGVAFKVEWPDNAENTSLTNKRVRRKNLETEDVPPVQSSPEINLKQESGDDCADDRKDIEEADITDKDSQDDNETTDNDDGMELKKEKRKRISAINRKEQKRINRRRWIKNSLPYQLDGTELQCNICNETFAVHKGLQMHMPIHFPNHVCEDCGRWFASKLQLRAHRVTHKASREACPVCQRIYKTTGLKAHMLTHTKGYSRYKCIPCKMSFPNYYDRHRHMVSEHGVEDKRYVCKNCSKRFRHTSDLWKHNQRVHLRVRKASCTHCDATFFSNTALRDHMIKHDSDKPFECEFCHKKYARHNTLKEHLKIHLGIKEFTCNICGRSFTQKCTLKGHMSVHEKESRLSEKVDFK